MNTAQLVENLLAHLRARNARPKTVLWYADLRRFARVCPVLPITPEPIEGFLADLPFSDETKYGYWRRLKALYKLAQKRYGLVVNPMLEVQAPERVEKVPLTLEEDELRALVAATRTQRDREMVLLAIDNGMRAAEIASLTWQQIRGDYILVRLKKREKYVPISEERKRGLLRLLEGRDGHGGDYIFLSQKGGKPLTANGVYQLFRKLMERAGIPGPKLGPHRVRHAVGRGMIMQGADLRTVQYTLGHNNLRSTEIYTKLTRPDVSRKHARFTLSRVVERPIQGMLFEEEAVEEAEVILRGEGG